MKTRLSLAVLLTTVISLTLFLSNSAVVYASSQSVNSQQEVSTTANSANLSNCPQPTDSESVIAGIQNNPAFSSLAANKEYNLESVGFEVGSNFCNSMYIFGNATYGFIEIIFNSVGSVILATHYPVTNISAAGGANVNWSGYEATANPNNLIIYIDNAQVDFTVPTNSTPSQGKNSNCCQVAEWVGLGDKAAASDGVLIQGGVLIGDGSFDYVTSGGTTYYSPMFFYEGVGTYAFTPWSSTCLLVNYGDSVNVTINKGTYGNSNQFDIQMVYGDNDPSSTCAIYLYMSYSISPTWVEYIFEAVSNSSCSYDYDPIYGTGVCQIIQFDTITYTAEMNIGFGWFGAFANTNNYNYYADWINQGVQNTAVSTSSNTAFVETWDSSTQT